MLGPARAADARRRGRRALRVDGPYRCGYRRDIIEEMSDPSQPASGATEQPDRPSRVVQAAAWVGIVAGIVFIVAVVFFSGFFVAWSTGYGGGGDQDTGSTAQSAPGPMMNKCPMMGGEGGRGPGPSPATSAPGPSRP
ncbi:hypothetical protein NJB1907Z4_C29310 [Mycobacterium pseudoshottsii]|uniref:Uncharacterized protein n=2 Tax=Mycobacterium TaxID=1763 RepID=A0A9N7LRG2_9MYCO|nr:hypothetical protein NJB1907Z4_C29310 [Mycobacterium pseudoshottsii]